MRERRREGASYNVENSLLPKQGWWTWNGKETFKDGSRILTGKRVMTSGTKVRSLGNIKISVVDSVCRAFLLSV